jgi:hypothetical protein
MPFSQTTSEHTEAYWNDHFNKFLKPLIESNPQLEARRSDPLRGDIVGQILAQLSSAPILVADITDHNPNVFWELGVRHTLHNATILIAQDPALLPFDVKPITVLLYDPKNHVKHDFVGRFTRALEDCIKDPERPDSPVTAALGKTTLLGILERERNLSKLDALSSELTAQSDQLEGIRQRAQDNIKDTHKAQWMAVYVRYPALEHLVVNRYIPHSPKIYQTAEYLIDSLVKINEMLDEWPRTGRTVDDYLLEVVPLALRGIERLRANIETVKKTLF